MFVFRGRKGLICQATLRSLFPLNVCMEINEALLLLKPLTLAVAVVSASVLR